MEGRSKSRNGRRRPGPARPGIRGGVPRERIGEEWRKVWRRFLRVKGRVLGMELH